MLIEVKNESEKIKKNGASINKVEIRVKMRWGFNKWKHNKSFTVINLFMKLMKFKLSEGRIFSSSQHKDREFFFWWREWMNKRNKKMNKLRKVIFSCFFMFFVSSSTLSSSCFTNFFPSFQEVDSVFRRILINTNSTISKT